MVLAVEESELEEGEELLSRVLALQLSYFAKAEDLRGLLEHLRGSAWAEVFEILWNGFDDDSPRKPFALWHWDDYDQGDWVKFKSLIEGLTRFDPAKRMTAEEALDHNWFKGL